MCVGSLGHLDNCKSCGVFNIFKSMFKNACIWLTSSTFEEEQEGATGSDVTGNGLDRK
jgi:hypothetical protein